MPDPIQLARPNITEAEINAVVEVLRTPNLSLGPKGPAFEAAFASQCGTKHAVACSSGTAALHMLIRAIGIEPDDEVITTPFSFIASANCVLMERGKPVFVDIDPDTWNIDHNLIDVAISSRTRAILPVDVFGQIAQMAPIRSIAHKHGLFVIEDACEALGGRYLGRAAGSLGHAGVFGFYPNKQVTTGEGGMIVTDDAALASLCRSLRNQGREDGAGWLTHARLGYNYRLSDINCALGLVQLFRLDETMAARARVASMYRERLADDPRVHLQRIEPDVDVSWFVFVVRLADSYTREQRDDILKTLRADGIACNNYFTPIHLQPFYVEQFGYKPGAYPVCESVSERTIALPFHYALTESNIDRVCERLRLLL